MSRYGEHLTITLDDGIGRDFDAAVHSRDGTRVLAEGGDAKIITKNDATVNGRAGAVITFTVDVDGKICRAQTVVTVRNLKFALKILDAAYDEEGRLR